MHATTSGDLAGSAGRGRATLSGMTQSHRSAAEIRASLDHPVIDADGHIIEYWPELDRFLRAEGVSNGMADFMGTATFDGSRMWATLTPEERMLLDDYERITAMLELMQSKARLSLKQAGLSS